MPRFYIPPARWNLDRLVLDEEESHHAASVLRLNECRTHDFRKGKPLGPYDRLVSWHKPQRQRKTATRRLWHVLPAQIPLRLIRYPVCIPGAFAPNRSFGSRRCSIP